MKIIRKILCRFGFHEWVLFKDYVGMKDFHCKHCDTGFIHFVDGLLLIIIEYENTRNQKNN